ncbi:13023_t:CDS:2, partial [Cetraspora pellucida]
DQVGDKNDLIAQEFVNNNDKINTINLKLEVMFQEIRDLKSENPPTIEIVDTCTVKVQIHPLLNHQLPTVEITKTIDPNTVEITNKPQLKL